MPRKRIEYRGVAIEEMDLDAVLARRPQVAVVDEIAHTNVPGSKNRKRYQDVLELLDAGINVIGALNVQHLESLNDLIARSTGVTVRETVPDSFLEQADQVVNLDLAVEDLLERLKAGKIYPPEKVQWALEHFFRGQNLSTLRELSLREVAESLDRSASQALASEAQARAPGRVMVSLSSNPPRAAAAPAPRLADGRPAQHRLVRRLRRDAGGVAGVASTPRPSATCSPTSRRRASSAPRWCASRRRTR